MINANNNFEIQFKKDISLLKKYINNASEKDRKILNDALSRLFENYVNDKINLELESIINNNYNSNV